MRKYIWFAAFLLGFVLQAELAHAQYSGHNLLGDHGLRSGSQAPVGRYAGAFFPYYRTGTVKLGDGSTVDTESTLDVFGVMPFVNIVSDVQILGGDLSVLAAVPFVNLGVEVSRFDLDTGNFGLADVYIQPFGLGWHTDRADFITSYAFTAPVGDYTAGDNDNLGLGMWSHEFNAGTSVFFDEDQSWHASSLFSYETHTRKRDVDIDVGDIVTLEYGIGKTLPSLTSIGLVGYAQWKVTGDSGTDIPLLLRGLKNRVFGIGPEASAKPDAPRPSSADRPRHRFDSGCGRHPR